MPVRGAIILPPSVLESRQSGLSQWELFKQSCHPRFWNQGKAESYARRVNLNLATLGFGIKAKHGKVDGAAYFDLATLGFGIKAKLCLPFGAAGSHLATLGFGIKAKPEAFKAATQFDLATLGFGIKAKLERSLCK